MFIEGAVKQTVFLIKVLIKVLINSYQSFIQSAYKKKGFQKGHKDLKG